MTEWRIPVGSDESKAQLVDVLSRVALRMRALLAANLSGKHDTCNRGLETTAALVESEARKLASKLGVST